MGNFNPDLYFQGDVVCDDCNKAFGDFIEPHFARKSFEGLIARLHLRKSSVILYDSSLLKFHFSPEVPITYNPLLLLVGSILDRIGSAKDTILLLKKNNLYAFVFAENVSSLKSQNAIRRVKYKMRDFREGTESAEWIGDKDDSAEIVQSALRNLGLKARFSKETVNEQPQQIKSSFAALQDVEINIARFVSKVSFEYFVYCASISGVISTIFSEELKPIRKFIRKGEGNAKSFVSVDSNNFISDRAKHGNNHYFVAFEVVEGRLIGKIAFMDTIAYQINFGRSPFSLASQRIGNGHAFNLTDKKVKKMYSGKAPIFSSSQFSIYNKF